MSRFAQAVAEAKVDVVPRVVVNGDGASADGGFNHGVMEGLLAVLLSEKLDGLATTADRSEGTRARSGQKSMRRSSSFVRRSVA